MKNITNRLSSFRFAILVAIAVVTVSTYWYDRAPATAQIVPTKIGTVDTEKILLTSNLGKAAMEQVKKLQENKEVQLRTMQQEIKDLQTRVQSGRGPADGAAQLTAKTNALRRAQDDATREINAARDKILGDIDTKVMPVIDIVAKEMKYAFIFRKFESGLIYADESTDITNVIIARMNSMAQ